VVLAVLAVVALVVPVVPVGRVLPSVMAATVVRVDRAVPAVAVTRRQAGPVPPALPVAPTSVFLAAPTVLRVR